MHGKCQFDTFNSSMLTLWDGKMFWSTLVLEFLLYLLELGCGVCRLFF